MLISRAWKWERVSDASADVRAAGLSTGREFIYFYKIQYQRVDVERRVPLHPGVRERRRPRDRRARRASPRLALRRARREGELGRVERREAEHDGRRLRAALFERDVIREALDVVPGETVDHRGASASEAPTRRGATTRQR